MAGGKIWSERELDVLKRVYNTATDVELVAAFPGRTQKAVYKKANKLGMSRSDESMHGKRSAAVLLRAKRNPYMTKKGYVVIYSPDCPSANKRGYIFEHIAVWEKHHNCAKPIGFCIHHINGKKTDNQIENLTLMTGSEHTTFHNKGTKHSELTRRKIGEKTKLRLKEETNHPRYKSIDLDAFELARKSGETVKDVCARFGINKTTYYEKVKKSNVITQ